MIRKRFELAILVFDHVATVMGHDITLNGIMTDDKLKKIWKEDAVVLLRNFSPGTEKTQERRFRNSRSPKI
jgi:hypothetical protein